MASADRDTHSDTATDAEAAHDAGAGTEPTAPDAETGAILLKLARSSIGKALGLDMPPVAEPAWLSEPGATSVTLTRNGALCGCIGSIEPRRPLGEDAVENAVAAAVQDSRFRPDNTA